MISLDTPCSQGMVDALENRMTQIMINDLKRHAHAVRVEVREAVERVFSRGWFILGPECVEFEKEFAAYCGSEHCISVANGTDALELAFRAVNIGEGSRIATVANAGFYTTTAIRHLRAEPVYVEVCHVDRLMDLDALAELAHSRRVDAVVLTHLFGRMHDAEKVRTLADCAGIPMIEDCAQAHGAKRGRRRAGSVGHVGCFSFYPTKNLGAFGDGGAITTNDPATASRLLALRQYGWTSKYRVELPDGRNSRLDELQAAVLRAKLPLLDEWNARRRDIKGRYNRAIRHPRVSCPALGSDDDVAHLYALITPDRDGLRAHLAKADIGCDIHYPIPDHLQPALAELRAWPSLPVTERLARQTLTLPCFPELTNDEVERIANRVNGW